MSHIVNIDVEVKDLQALKNTCKRMGWTFSEGQKTYKWYGHFVGDSPMPEGMTEADLGKCDHAIKIPNCDYEIGVAKVGEKYQLRMDWWSSGGLEEALGGQNAPVVKQNYAVELAKLEGQKNGYSVYEKKLDNGCVQVVLEGGW